MASLVYERENCIASSHVSKSTLQIISSPEHPIIFFKRKHCYIDQHNVFTIFNSRPIPGTVSIEVKSCKIKFLEHVQIKVDLDFSRRGDLSLQLKAPSGTTSPLTRKRSIDNLTRYRNLTDWVITTLFHWGEDPTGKWELIIEDFDKRIPSSGYYLLRKLLIIIVVVVVVVVVASFAHVFVSFKSFEVLSTFIQ